MKVAAYTSFTFAYLGRARVLAATFKAHNPNWEIVAVITDRAPPEIDFDEDLEPFDRIVWYDELNVDNLMGWLYFHDVVEVCTAVKGHALVKLLDEGYDRVFYLDPDIAVYESLDPLLEIHESYSISLTPHLLDQEKSRYGIIDNEIGSLKCGVYNLGYVGVSNDKAGNAFAKWWAERLQDHCYDDIPNGLFTDQRWCDLTPALFPNVKIIRDPGYNVASWNLGGRHVEIDEQGVLRSNGSTLRFFHYTKMGPMGRRMTLRYRWGSPAVLELWRQYEAWHEDAVPEDLPAKYWYFGNYENGEPIDKADRRLYRDRLDLQMMFPDPYRTGTNSFHEWLQASKIPEPELKSPEAATTTTKTDTKTLEKQS